MATPGVEFDTKKPTDRKGIEPTQVKSIKLLTALDNGSKNDGTGKGVQPGMLYGKTYSFKVSAYTNGNPNDLKKIKWKYKYHSLSKNKWIEKSSSKTGDTYSLHLNEKDICGRTLHVMAYINDSENEGYLKIWNHNRFRWFDSKIFLDGLAARKDDPSKIDQHYTSLCGTAALIYFFAQDFKEKFFSAYKEFFRTGEQKINSFKLAPNKSLYEMQPTLANLQYPHYDKYSNGKPIIPHKLMHISDWIILAGTRSSDNHNYEGTKNENWDAINWCNYMVLAIKNLYGASSVEDKTSIITRRNYSSTLIEIQKLYQEGWHILLMIDSDMLDDSVSYLGCVTNYHWISYEGDLIFDEKNKKYQFSYYSYHQLFKSVSFRSKVFNSNFYGFIKFKK